MKEGICTTREQFVVRYSKGPPRSGKTLLPPGVFAFVREAAKEIINSIDMISKMYIPWRFFRLVQECQSLPHKVRRV
jgi:hypothetical protein